MQGHACDPRRGRPGEKHAGKKFRAAALFICAPLSLKMACVLSPHPGRHRMEGLPPGRPSIQASQQLLLLGLRHSRVCTAAGALWAAVRGRPGVQLDLVLASGNGGHMSCGLERQRGLAQVHVHAALIVLRPGVPAERMQAVRAHPSSWLIGKTSGVQEPQTPG